LQWCYTPGQAPHLKAPRISIHSAQEGGNVVSPTHRSPLLPGDIPVTLSCYRLSRLQNNSADGRISSMKIPSDPIGYRTRDIPAGSAVPQLTAISRAPFYALVHQISQTV
jgi:hypothetical protein